jgi:hypothetical protein
MNKKTTNELLIRRYTDLNNAIANVCMRVR